MKLARLALVLLLTHCGYPEFRFVADDTAPTSADSAVVDSTAPEVSADSTTDSAAAPETSRDASLDTADTTVVDTGPVDTGADACASCAPGETCSAGACHPQRSCAAIRAAFPALPSGAYRIDPDDSGPLTPFRAFCDTGDGDGWTLALKADGALTTFAYDAALWTNDAVLNPTSTDLLKTEAKFRSFSELPVKQLRLSMVDAGITRTIVLDAVGTSLKAMVSGPTITTTAGRVKWLSLVADPSLQTHCNAEGLNIDFTGTMLGPKIRLRIGIAANQETDCSSPDSFLGFGSAISSFYCFGDVDPMLVVGNLAGTMCGAPVSRTIRTFGYVFVR